MRLSEAIRLGSLAIQNPRAGDSRYCAIGMACKAVGLLSMDDEIRNYSTVNQQWPWTVRRHTFGNRNNPCYGSDAIWYDFDTCVIHEKSLTFDAFCDRIAAWEDELAAKGINVEQVTMAAELTEPACQAAEHKTIVGAQHDLLLREAK